MELKQLERFLAVYDRGSLAEAAKSLGLTQQAISSTLANMEEEIGTRLFERAPGGVTRATAAGEKTSMLSKVISTARLPPSSVSVLGT